MPLRFGFTMKQTRCAQKPEQEVKKNMEDGIQNGKLASNQNSKSYENEKSKKFLCDSKVLACSSENKEPQDSKALLTSYCKTPFLRENFNKHTFNKPFLNSPFNGDSQFSFKQSNFPHCSMQHHALISSSTHPPLAPSLYPILSNIHRSNFFLNSVSNASSYNFYLLTWNVSKVLVLNSL